MNLNELAIQHDTDKSSKHHNYCNAYEQFLEMHTTPFKKVLEIGIHRGGSLRMWRDFFPEAEVFGWDILPECLIQEDRIHSFKVDASKVEDMQVFFDELSTNFDLVIDDGSHTWKDQMLTFTTIFPLLKSGAIYILEDLHTSNHSSYKDMDITPLFIFENLKILRMIGYFEFVYTDGVSLMMVKK